MTVSKTLTAFIGSAAALAMLPAMAASTAGYGTKSVEISTAGYDLANAADAQVVYKKIEKAAKRVCATPGVLQSLSDRIQEKQCRADTIARTIESINAPTLTIVMRADRAAS